MTLKISSAPAVEPISLAEVKIHLRVNSESYNQSIVYGSHVIAAAYSLEGYSFDVLGYSTTVKVTSGDNLTGGTVDIKLQHSDDNITFVDVASGSFTQITTLNDNMVYTKAYTGTKQYLRVVSTVAVAACTFGVEIIKDDSETAENNLINSLITTAREYCEKFQNRAYINQTWEFWMDAFPTSSGIRLDLPPLVSVSSIKYYDTSNVEYTLDPVSYFTDTKSEPGWVYLNYGYTWPSITLREINAVCVTYVAGYGATGTSTPAAVRQAILLLVGHFYEHRESVTDKQLINVPTAVDSLLSLDRVWPI